MYSDNVKVHLIKFIAGPALLSGILLAPNSSLGALPAGRHLPTEFDFHEPQRTFLGL